MRRAQSGVFGLLIIDAVFILVMALGLGGWINEQMMRIVAEQQLTGLEGFFLTYWLVFVFLFFLLGNAVILFFGGGQ